MKLNEQLEKGRVVYIREPYYITEIGRAMDDQKLYRVYKDTNYWRDVKISKYTSVYLEHCIEWINKRRCFIKKPRAPALRNNNQKGDTKDVN